LGLAEDVHLLPHQVHHPDLRYPCLGVEGELHLEVVVQAGFGHLHHQEGVLGLGHPFPVKVVPVGQQGQVRLGFGVGKKAQGVLDLKKGLLRLL